MSNGVALSHSSCVTLGWDGMGWDRKCEQQHPIASCWGSSWKLTRYWQLIFQPSARVNILSEEKPASRVVISGEEHGPHYRKLFGFVLNCASWRLWGF